MSRRVVVDARPRAEVVATTVVVGIPLLVRTLRACARAGVAAAQIWVRDREHRASVSRALADYPVPTRLDVEIEIAGDQRAAPEFALTGSAIYDRAALDGAGERAIEPALVIADPGDLARARRWLFASIVKPIELDGAIAYYVQRPLSRLITRVVVDTRLSANHATLLALAAGLAAAVLATRGDYLGWALAGALYWTSGVLDCVDGDLARIRIESSRLGEWLDSMTDEINTLSLLVGIGVGLEASGEPGYWIWLCAGGAAIGALTLARLYVELVRRGSPIDTAHFPWFFSGGNNGGDGDGPQASGFGRVVVGLGYLIRRDANVTGISIILVAGLPRLAAALLVVAFTAVFVLALVHFAVMAVRSRRER